MGYPVLLKAVAGGGGKGMRLVNSDAEFDSGSRCFFRSMNAFGDDASTSKNTWSAPSRGNPDFRRHHGRVVSLGERECSIQRAIKK